MNNWFVIANEDMAIVAKEDGTLVLLPDPVLTDHGQQREVVATGSDKGARTFRPGAGVDLTLGLTTDEPVQIHAQIPAELRVELGNMLNRACLAAQTEINILLEDSLTPKQKETDNDRDG